jgi:hypothetical protein
MSASLVVILLQDRRKEADNKIKQPTSRTRDLFKYFAVYVLT